MKTKRPRETQPAHEKKSEWANISIDLKPTEVKLTNSKLLEVAQAMGALRDKASSPQWEITQKIGVIYRAIRDHVEDYDAHRNSLLQEFAIKQNGEIVRGENGDFRLVQPDYNIAFAAFMRKEISLSLPLWHWRELAWLHGSENEASITSPLIHIIAED